MNMDAIRAWAGEIDGWVRDRRRALHAIPERGHEVFKTQAYITGTLDSLGVPYIKLGAATVGLIEGRGAGKCVGLRADVDALPILEPEGCPFRSTHEGMMHACGHDAHAAILLGAARVLSEHRDAFSGRVKLLFQPAEETDGGAKPMIDAGALENPYVDCVYGLHVMPYLPAGEMETRAGTLNAASDCIEIVVRGKSGHGAYPDTARDAIVCAAQIIVTLQTLVARNVSPLDSAVVSFGTINGGRAENVICGEVRMEGTIRSATPETRELLNARVIEVARGVASAMGCEAEVIRTPSYCALINDDFHVARVMRVASDLLGASNAHVKSAPSMGAEDFGYFCAARPGAFYHIGCGFPGEPYAPLHSDHFRLNEDCLRTGVAMQTALAMEALG